MIKKNSNNISSSSKKSFLSRSKLEDRRLFTQIRHYFLDQRLLYDESILLQFSTLLSRRLKNVFQSSQFKKFLISVVKFIESNLTELDLFKEYNLQNLITQRSFSLSSNINQHRRLINISFFEKIEDTRHKESVEMINIIISEF